MTTLTPKREKFAQGVASGMSQAEAYRASFSTKNMKATTVNQAASRLMANSNILATVEKLRKPIVERVQITLESHLNRLRDLALAAESAEQYGAAIKAEELRGKASGIYVDKVDLSNTDGTMRPTLIKIVAAK